jgi:hypothetical protein
VPRQIASSRNVRGPVSQGDRHEFEGFGIETAEEIRFPLDPGKQLVVTRNVRTPSARVNPARSGATNQEAATSKEVVVAHACEGLAVTDRSGPMTLTPRSPG